MDEESLPTPCRPATEDFPRFPSILTASATSVQHHSQNTAVIEESPDKPAPSGSSAGSSRADGMGPQKRNRRKISQLLTSVHHTAPSRSGNILDERRNLIRLQRKLLLEERAEKIKDFKEKELERRERGLERRENALRRRESRKERAFKEQEREKLNRILALKEEYLLQKIKMMQVNKW